MKRRGHGIPAQQIFDAFRPISNSTDSASPDSAKRKRKVVDISSDDETLDAFKESHISQYARRPFGKKKKTFRESIETVELEDENGNKEVLIYKVTEGLTKSSRARKKYTCAYLCAGACGTSTGASMAGFKIKYLLDIEPDCCKTLKLNFGGVAVLEMDISALSEDNTLGATGGDHVDVMHISFPY